MSLGLMDFVGGIALHFAVQHDAATNIAQLSYVAAPIMRVNFGWGSRSCRTAGRSDWILVLGLAMLLVLACWRVAGARQSVTPVV